MRFLILLSFLFHFSFLEAQLTNKELGEELDFFIKNQMESQPFPSVAACIVKNGEIVWKNAYGTANLETETPATTQTLYTLASISKLFTATACVQLAQNGIIDLDTDINEYIPFKIINPNFPETPITTRGLLQHKSSLADFESDLQLWDEIGDPIFTLAEFCEKYFVEGGELYDVNNWETTPPQQSSYWYSNAGFTLLGFIVESASEMPFNEYCELNIQIPLEMYESKWFISELNTENVAMPYSFSNGNFIPYGYFSVPEYPAAMLRSNIDELANFLIAYTQKGWFNNFELINEASFNETVPESMTDGFGWWGKDTWYGDKTGKFWGHGGFMNGVRTQLNYYPTDSTGLIILTNGTGNYTTIQNKLEEYIPLFTTENTDTITSSTTNFQPEISIFPNPTNDFLYLTFNQKVDEIKIWGVDGKLWKNEVFYHRPTNFYKVDVSELLGGVYWLEVRVNDTFFTQKIVKN